MSQRDIEQFSKENKIKQKFPTDSCYREIIILINAADKLKFKIVNKIVQIKKNMSIYIYTHTHIYFYNSF